MCGENECRLACEICQTRFGYEGSEPTGGSSQQGRPIYLDPSKPRRSEHWDDSLGFGTEDADK